MAPPEVAAMWEVLAPLVDDLEVAKPQDGLAFTVLCELRPLTPARLWRFMRRATC